MVQFLRLLVMRLPIAAAFACALIAGAAGAAPTEAAAKKLAVQVCALCHGAGGRSISPTFPVLAGQTAPYIETQLQSFKNQTRQDPDAQAFMWGMASELDESTIKGLAQFYSSEPPQPGVSIDPKLAAAGRELFERGKPSAGVPPCASCHGPNAQGNGQYPRLAGQHAAYQVKQLQAFRSGLRASPIMQPIAAKLSNAEMRAAAAYTRSE
jgi:cytochrome c553